MLMPDDLSALSFSMPGLDPVSSAEPPFMPGAGQDLPTARHDRTAVVAFIVTAEAEAALREGLADSAREGIEVRRGGIRSAISALQRMPTPRVLIVDVGGEDHPLTELGKLAEVVEPDVHVLVVGEANDLDFYRQVTKGLGALEYLAQPLTRDRVARYFGPLIAGHAAASKKANSGHTVTVTGARGGVGATTVATQLAWLFAVDARRHTLLLDPDLHMGTTAMMLDGKTSSGLRTALETPERIDPLFIERATQPVAHPSADRLHVLAGEEQLSEQPIYAPGAARQLLQVLHRRYSIVVADVPFAPAPFYRDLLDLAQQRVLVLAPTLASIRDTRRLLALPNGPAQTRRAVLVLNRLGIVSGLTRRQVEDALETKIDVVIPDLPRQIGQATTMGEPAAAAKGQFHAGIVELAKQVAFERLLDSSMLASQAGDVAALRWSPFRSWQSRR
jgi:pilus assembly protein CpaE